MKSAFLTETNYRGKWPKDFPNTRTEIAWQIALDSDHFNIHDYEQVKEYDFVFIIFPKATVKLNTVGMEMTNSTIDRDISIYEKPIVEVLKKNNGKVCNIQEGPSWFFNEYDILTQFNFYNQLAECDILFVHNGYDTGFYRGLFPKTRVEVIPTLMIITNALNSVITTEKENKAIIGGNFCRWYGGFQSYIIASEFDCPIYVPSMHCKRQNEESIPNLTHLPYMNWNQWMINLSQYKYAVHLMPTIAAGTFSLNCAYWGIPCIGNENVDTQLFLHPDLSVNVDNIYDAKHLAIRLRNDKEVYRCCSQKSKDLIKKSRYSNVEIWLEYMENILKNKIENKIEKITSVSTDHFEDITVVFTSCGRFDLLKKTFDSFVTFNTYPIKKYIVVDNSTKPESKKEIEEIFKGFNVEIIINETNIGQVSSIDKAYSSISTEYIFHCEDDWEFFDYEFIKKSIDVLKYDKNLINVNLRVRFDGERGSLHPVTEMKTTSTGTNYHEYIPNYLGAWHGFSWNPGLRKLEDYNNIKPYKKYGEESGVGKKYYEMGRRSACLEKFYCKHIGQSSTCEGRNS